MTTSNKFEELKEMKIRNKTPSIKNQHKKSKKNFKQNQ